MRHPARAAALVAALALGPGCSPPGGPAAEPDLRALGDGARQPAPGEPGIHLAAAPSGERTIDVAGLPAEDLAHLAGAALSREAWQALLRVHVAPVDPAAAELPAVLGDYAVDGGKLRFTPRFPFAAGQRYEVVFDPSSLPSARDRSTPTPPRTLHTTVEVPAPDLEPSTRVAAVYPTGPAVPENHLRLYIVFSDGLGADGPGCRHPARPAARRARRARRRRVPAAGRRPVECGPHALHGPLRPGARQARHPAQRRAGTPAGGRIAGTRW